LLPVSGADLAVHEPAGADEVFIVETGLAPMPAILAAIPSLLYLVILWVLHRLTRPAPA